MTTELVHIGFGNVLAMNRVVAIVSPGAAPSRRLVQDKRQGTLVIDMTSGRRTKAIIILDSGHIALAAITPETIAGRLAASRQSQVGLGPSPGLEASSSLPQDRE